MSGQGLIQGGEEREDPCANLEQVSVPPNTLCFPGVKALSHMAAASCVVLMWGGQDACPRGTGSPDQTGHCCLSSSSGGPRPHHPTPGLLHPRFVILVAVAAVAPRKEIREPHEG
jgi:hypothetical protein